MHTHDLNYDTYYLAHHGIKGQKWGVRRYQNPDGSLKPEGEKRHINKKKLKIAGAIIGTAAIAAGASYCVKKMDMKATDILNNKFIDVGFEMLKNSDIGVIEDANKYHDRAIKAAKFGNEALRKSASELANMQYERSARRTKEALDLIDRGRKNTSRDYSIKQKVRVLKNYYK